MAGYWQPWRKWTDEASPQQYSFSSNARIRRAPLEDALDGKDYYGDAYWQLRQLPGITAWARILSVGAGDGQDEARYAIEFDHRGQIVCLELPPPLDPQKPQSRQWNFNDRFIVAQDSLQRAGKDNVSWVPGNMLDLPFEDGSFDVVEANHVLYHASNVIRAILEARRVLRHGGVFQHLTNGQDNSKLKHETLQKMAQFMGAEAPEPFSVTFNQQRADKILPFFFKLIQPIRQNSWVPIDNEDKLRTFMSAVDTYRPSFGGDISGWSEARKRVEDELWKRIEHEGVIFESVHRGGGHYENSLDHKFIKNIVGTLALKSCEISKRNSPS